MAHPPIDELLLENQRLRHLLEEAEDTVRALRAGEIDAVLVGTDTAQVYTLDTADRPYQLMVDQMPLGAASFTTDGTILHSNRRFASLLGRPLSGLVGKSIYDFLAVESRPPFESLLRGMQDAEVRAEVTLQRDDGTRVRAYLGVNALREGPLGMCLVVTDLTEKKLYAELQDAQEALREEDRRKSEFIAILAHELRNPLGPIRNATRVLKLKGPRGHEFTRPIEMIERQTAQLTRLLDDLLDASRISRGVLEMHREHVALSDIVDASLEACHEELQARGVSLEVSLLTYPIDLVADRARLIQLLCNLISNAAKYTPSDGKIELTATASAGTLRLSVKDNGMGIPPERLSDIFDLFTQVDRSKERQGGLGIGLGLVRQIALLHGGSVEARSEGIGHGSEFILTLPGVATAPATPASATVPESGPAAAPRRILVVDDSNDAAESLTMLLQMAGHRVHKAVGGEEAIALAQQVRPDVVLLDLGMPIVSGYDVAQQIREQPWGEQVHLVALTGWGHAGERLRTEEAGFDAHLVKPVSLEALDRLLATLSARPGQSAAQ